MPRQTQVRRPRQTTKGNAMKAFTLVYSGTNQPVVKGDLFKVGGKTYAYAGDWDIVDVVQGMGLTIVDTDLGMVEAHHIGVELAYAGE